MKYLIIVFAIIATSCTASKPIPLSGNYTQTPIVIQSANSFDVTWDKLIDIFAQQGLAIKLIDRSSGLIVSEKSKLTSTIENKDGSLARPLAFIAVPSVMEFSKRVPISGYFKPGPYAKESQIKYNDVYGDWNVRIKKTETGSTINVNINNVMYESYNANAKIYVPTALYGYKSTGIFEKQLADLIK